MTVVPFSGARVLQQYYISGEPELSEVAREILSQYGGIPDAEHVRHVKRIRDTAWSLFRAPCIGSYSFIRFNISDSPQYSEVLKRVQGGHKLLDLGCSLAQDLRKLVYDGAPAQRLTGLELEQGFLDLGYDLFRDRETFAANLVSGDFFERRIKGLKDRSFDIIHAAAFFHLFSWDDQAELMRHALRLLKPKSGSMIFGMQNAVAEPGVVRHPATRAGEVYRHNAASFEKLVLSVAKRDKLQVDSHAALEEVAAQRRVKLVADAKVLRFCITIR